MRKRYIMKQVEVDTLVSTIISRGAESTYDVMKEKIFASIETVKDLDESLIDMSEFMLELGRENLDKESDISANVYYTLSFILRKIGHEIHREYLKEDKEKNSERFIHLVYSNPEPLNII